MVTYRCFRYCILHLSCFLYLSTQNAKAILDREPPIVMRQVHCIIFRKVILKTLLDEACKNNDTTCDFPFCTTHNEAHSDWVECEQCERWIHLKWVGLTERSNADESWTNHIKSSYHIFIFTKHAKNT